MWETWQAEQMSELKMLFFEVKLSFFFLNVRRGMIDVIYTITYKNRWILR